MKKNGLVWLSAVAIMGGGGSLHAGQELAQKNNCMVCHQVEVKSVGPSYKEVAAKYRAVDGAGQLLQQRVRAGGSGNWGAIPMPPNTAIGDSDLQAIIQWILAQQ